MPRRPRGERPDLPQFGRVYGEVQRQSGEFLDVGGEFSAGIASIDDAARFEQEHRSLGVGARSVLDAARHDEKLARSEHDITISHLDGELSV